MKGSEVIGRSDEVIGGVGWVVGEMVRADTVGVANMGVSEVVILARTTVTKQKYRILSL